MPEYSTVVYVRVTQSSNMSEYASICLNIPQYALISLNMPEHGLILLNVPEYV